MKKLLISLLILMSTAGFTQKIAYVDSQYILDNIPDYKLAQEQLDEMSKKWQKEIETELAVIDKMYKTYQADAVLLPEDIKKKREDEIMAKEKEVKALQKKRFGQDGDLFKKREELIKPIQDKVYNAIEELSVEKGYSIIFDKSGSLTILYASSKIDISDQVLTKLGYSPTKTGTQNKTNTKTGEQKTE
jgi:outer membrane protein